jgi:hypothetical protein
MLEKISDEDGGVRLGDDLPGGRDGQRHAASKVKSAAREKGIIGRCRTACPT